MLQDRPNNSVKPNLHEPFTFPLQSTSYLGSFRSLTSQTLGHHGRAMRISFVTYLFCGSLVLFGCSRPTNTPHSDVTTPPTDSLRKSVGQRVTLTGVAERWKIGPSLHGDGFLVGIDGLDDWPPDFVNRKVQVTGLLEERHDLPVFVADTPEERGRMQGIPVPSGTDLDKASRRYVISNAKWSLSK
jgi:hypothetical protein